MPHAVLPPQRHFLSDMVQKMNIQISWTLDTQLTVVYVIDTLQIVYLCSHIVCIVYNVDVCLVLSILCCLKQCTCAERSVEGCHRCTWVMHMHTPPPHSGPTGPVHHALNRCPLGPRPKPRPVGRHPPCRRSLPWQGVA